MNPALELAILAALKSEIAKREAVLKETFLSEHGRGTQYPSVEGVEVGQVTTSKGRETWTVYDEAELVKWVKANHPTEIQETVNPAFKRKVLDDCKAAGANVDRNGELIPGIRVSQSDPYVTVKPDVDAIKSLVSLGRLSWVVPQELESPL